MSFGERHQIPTTDAAETYEWENQIDGDGEGYGDDNGDNDDNNNKEDNPDDEPTNEKMFKLFAAWYCDHVNELKLLIDRIDVMSLSSGSNDPALPGPSINSRTWSLPVANTGARSDGELICSSSSAAELSLGSIFMSKEELIHAIALYHVQQRVESRTTKSSTSRLTTVCRYEECSYKLCARGEANIWRITTLNAEHTCNNSLMHNRHRSISAKALGQIYAPSVAADPQAVSTRRIISEMKLQHGFSVTYCVALQAKHRAFEVIYGGHTESWARIPRYLHLLQTLNPGTIVALQLDEGVFQYLFYALGPSILGFQRAGVPVIVIDGTHLKGKYRGIMFVAATLDGNHQIFPLAAGIGDVECRPSWTWFLGQLRRSYGCPENLLIVSDRHESIKYAVAEVYPEAHHAFCYYHMTKQIRSYGKIVIEKFYKAAYCYRLDHFDRYMASIQQQKPEAFRKLTEDAPIATWARCCSPVKRYGIMTSNACESFNSKLLWARRLPVCSLLECARATTEKWFSDRRADSESRIHPLTEWAKLRLEPVYTEGQTFSVSTLGMHRYKVQDGTRHYVVDLQQRICDCCVFQTDCLPCSHASAAIREIGDDPLNYINDHYKTFSLVKMYQGVINPIPHPNDWSVPEEIAKISVIPPNPPNKPVDHELNVTLPENYQVKYGVSRGAPSVKTRDIIEQRVLWMSGT